jgi:UPF0271 protein
MPTIDLNADLGEGFPWDEAILRLVSSTSVCCGAHAGDADCIRRTLQLAQAKRVSVGAHPGYADRDGFGRRDQSLGREAVKNLVVDQVETLRGWSRADGAEIRFIKPHGALYNQAQREIEIGAGVLDAAESLRLPILGQPGTLLEHEARRRGVGYLTEGFPDRRYRPDGSLVPRSSPDAKLYEPEEVRANVLGLIGQGVNTLCVHGDDARAVAQAELLRRILEDAGWSIRSPFA